MTIYLKDFEKGKCFKGLQLNKLYTLEELGIKINKMKYENYLNAFNVFHFNDEKELKEKITFNKEQIIKNNLLKENDILENRNTPNFINEIYNTLDEKDKEYYEMLLYLSEYMGEIKKLEEDYVIILKKDVLEKTLKERFENFKEFLNKKIKEMNFKDFVFETKLIKDEASDIYGTQFLNYNEEDPLDMTFYSIGEIYDLGYHIIPNTNLNVAIYIPKIFRI